MKVLSFIRSLFSRTSPKQEVRHTVKLPDGGEAELINPNYQRHGYALLERNGKQLIRRPDGSFVTLNGETDFLCAIPSANGAVIVRLDGEHGKRISLVEEDGGVFSVDGTSGFYEAWREPDGSTIFAVLPSGIPNADCWDALYSLVERDGSLFKHEGETQFLWMRRHKDGSTVVRLKKDNKYEREKSHKIIEKSGDVFSFDGVTSFDALTRNDDGSTLIERLYGKLPIRETWLVEADGSLFQFSLPEKDLEVVNFSGRSSFESIYRYGNGYTGVEIEKGVCALVDKEGKPVVRNGTAIFPRISYQEDDTIEIDFFRLHREKIKPDGTVLSNRSLINYRPQILAHVSPTRPPYVGDGSYEGYPK